jgi:rhombotail lipoprotein
MRFRQFLLVATLLGIATGCSWFYEGAQGRQGVSSSVVDYLYPAGEAPPPPSDALPHLALPVKAGLAFVPAKGAGALTEAQRQELLMKTRAAFLDRDFIASIEVIPETYLNTGRGFETLDSVARLYGLDVIALVSYDQVAFVDDRKSSVLYWTIIGAYVIKGSEHEIQTFVDTAVFDMGTRQLLFRAAGTDRMEKTSTLVDVPEARREASEKSFEKAMADMTTNLDRELDVFKERVKEEKVAVVTHRPGYEGGGGSLDPLFVLLAAAAAGALGGRRPRP